MRSFPYKIGYDCAGVVTEIGADVRKIKVGDEVYVRLPESCRGIKLPNITLTSAVRSLTTTRVM